VLRRRSLLAMRRHGKPDLWNDRTLRVTNGNCSCESSRRRVATGAVVVTFVGGVRAPERRPQSNSGPLTTSATCRSGVMSKQQQFFKVRIEHRNPGYSRRIAIAICSVCGKRESFVHRVGALAWADNHENYDCEDTF
jgi:hypothetical protein